MNNRLNGPASGTTSVATLGSAAVSEEEKRREIFRFAKVVARRWGPIALVLGVVVGSVAALGTLMMFERQYNAKLYFRVIRDQEWVELAKGAGDRHNTKGVLAMMKSDVITRRVAADSEVAKANELLQAEDPIAKLASMVSVKSVGGDEFFAISTHSNRPRDASLISLKYWQKFNEEQDRFRVRQANILLETLEGEISSYSDRLKALQRDLQKTHDNMTQSESAVVIGDSGNVSSAALARYELEKQRNDAALELTRRDYEELSQTGERQPQDEGDRLAMELAGSADVVSAEANLRRLRFDVRQAQTQYGVSHPNYRVLKVLVDEAEKELDHIRHFRRGQLSDRMEQNEQRELGQEREQLEQRLEVLELNERMIAANIAKEREKIRTFKNLRFEYERMQEKHEVARETLLALNKRAREIRLKQIAPFRVVRMFIDSEVEEVPIPKRPVEKYPLKMLLAAAGGGLICPVLLFGAWEYRVRRVSVPEQVSERIGLIGEIADLPARFGRRTILHRQKRVFEEGFNNVSTYLRTRADVADIRSLAVTSSVSNEGKTTFACQLAISLAKTSGGRVLLIDCDLRIPSVQDVFRLERGPGVMDVLQGRSTLQKAAQTIAIEDAGPLAVLTAGESTVNPHRLLSTSEFSDLVAEAKSHFDYVVIDTPPVLAASEALLAARQADATIMCVLRDVSRIDTVRRASDRLLNSLNNLAGYVFAGVPQAEYSKRYGAYDYGDLDEES
ncbi:MAG: polysaccharide biosynthesis tyrosine autokinase [Planctomycetota bacterium]